MFNLIKKRKRLLLMVSMLAMVFVLAACGTSDVTAESEGFWDGIIIYNFARLIIWFSDLFGGNYGIGIIMVTVLIRALMIPITHFQQKNMQQMNEINPQLTELRERYSARDAETQEKLRNEQQKLYKEAGVNPFLGFLPLLIQMPVFIALYQAVNRTPILATGDFLWVNLGAPDPYFILPLLAGAFTLANSHLMSLGRPQAGGKFITYIMPLFIVLITFRLSSALALYFVASNGFAVLQTLLLQNPYKIRREREEKEARQREIELERRKARKRAQKLGRNVRK
ncbi:YidC/Oxa1 family membrane protein insertase [Marinilactibacillus piezotolerans]|uniref:YidC/Oxa1 family membrane protein insertase n=1 Tax=Marinilactibacillus piezotolerans TaxID=258723 RepID=UPI002117F679|nr:membrane protein insertase YidC [Marinilactibacillus piezotolerans]